MEQNDCRDIDSQVLESCFNIILEYSRLTVVAESGSRPEVQKISIDQLNSSHSADLQNFEFRRGLP